MKGGRSTHMDILSMADSHRLIILTAPSGAGKTTIAHAVIKALPMLGFTISATTRAPRAGEVNGKDYYFLSIPDFERKISEQAFIEYEMVYAGKYYGTLYSELERIWQQGKTPLRVIDVVGAAELKKKFSTRALSIFIHPPSTEALHKRLQLRGTENREALEERLKRANMEMKFASQFDQIIINDILDEAILQTQKSILSFLQDDPIQSS